LQAERQKAIVFESSCEVRIFGKNKLAGWKTKSNCFWI
jgi:hypothetical protein